MLCIFALCCGSCSLALAGGLRLRWRRWCAASRSTCAAATASAGSACWANVIGMGQAHGQVRQFCGGCLRIDEHDLPGDCAAFVFVRIVDAVDPIVRPGGFFFFRLTQRVLP